MFRFAKTNVHALKQFKISKIVLFTQKRNIYDLKAQKLAYKIAKEEQDRLNHPENVEFSEAMRIFKNYTLGLDLPISAHIELTESAIGGAGKVLKGDVKFQHEVEKKSKISVLIFAEGDAAKNAIELGAAIVGGEGLIAQLSDPEYFSKIKIDKVLCTSALFPQVVKIAKILGPLGLMPSPSKGTVSDDLQLMMSSLRSSTLFESDTDKYIHIDVGSSMWSDEKIEQNLFSLFKSIQLVSKSKEKSSSAIKGVSISAAPLTPGIMLPTTKLIEKFHEMEIEASDYE